MKKRKGKKNEKSNQNKATLLCVRANSHSRDPVRFRLQSVCVMRVMKKRKGKKGKQKIISITFLHPSK